MRSTSGGLFSLPTGATSARNEVSVLAEMDFVKLHFLRGRRTRLTGVGRRMLANRAKTFLVGVAGGYANPAHIDAVYAVGAKELTIIVVTRSCF